ncbi:hypothetical protein DSL72_000961 [Monilinia vaccinii-corymbosi]|uniref:Uncharacterized protein n=1 Tax=Monilinia vaccinii-corymbosi TaxID=61207 RepID=A0A8A3P6Q2_9HELO|nr:hypothetical protein DSL72_000961 [Monilinia vaccinii-corymbosi]
MELDDRWDPDPLPNGNPRNQSLPRITQQAVRNSEAQTHYYNHGQASRPRETDQNLHLDFYDVSDEDSSSNEYPVVLHQPQVNQKRVRGLDKVLPDRRKRHQSEHPSGVSHGRTTKIEETMFDHSSVISKSRNWSVARSGARITGPADDLHNEYRTENALPASRKPISQSYTRELGSHQDRGYIATEDYYEEFTTKPSPIASQNNDSAKRRIREEQFYSSVPQPTGPNRQDSSRIDRELAVAPKARQRVDFSRAQSVVMRSSYDDVGTFHTGTESVASSDRSQRQRHKPQLGSPLWPNHESSMSKPSPVHRIQGNIERSSSRNSVPVTPRKQSVKSRSIVPNKTQSGASKPRAYSYDFIDDDDINDTPLENDLRVKPNAQVKFNDKPIDFINALPKHSAFQSRKPQAAKQVYQTPPRNSNRAITSGLTIDLVTPESARGSIPFLPPNWTPRTRGPIKTGSVKVSTPLKLSMKDVPIISTSQQPEEDVRQRQAAEKIIRKELNAERECLQKDLFGEVVGETEEEKREQERVKCLEANRAREEKERQLAIDAEVKRRKAEVRAQKEREKKEAEQLEKDKEAAAKKAKRDAERHHQSLREEQAAAERRNAANKILQEKKERDMALLKALDEQKQIVDRQKRESDAKIEKMERSMQQLHAQFKAKEIATLKPARKSTIDSGTRKAVEVPTISTSLPTEMDIDDEDSLFVPETENATDEVFPDRQLSNELQAQDENSDSNSTIAQFIEQGRAPASMAEVFANTNSKPGDDKVREDREVEREAIRKQRAEERLAMQRKRAKSVPAEPSPKSPPRKARAISKAPSKAVPKKKSAQPLAKSPAKALFGTKLKPLHGTEDSDPHEEQHKADAIAENPIVEVPISRPRSLPLPLPPPLPAKTNTTLNKPETRLISQAERDEIEAGRERIQAEAKARKDAFAKQQADAKKEELEQKRTVEYRKKKEKQLRDQARKDGKELGEFELKTILEKVMDKRERDKKRRNQRRAGETVSSSDHEAVPNSNLPNSFGIALPQSSSAQASSPLFSSSDTVSDGNHVDEDDDPETQARKEHEARTAESLKALAQSRAARRFQILPVEKPGRLFNDDSSDESEEDPDDEETTEAMVAHAKKVAAAKATEKTDGADLESMTDYEIALERDLEADLEAAFEAELIIEGEPESATAQLNSENYGLQIVAPMPDMTSYFQSSSTQRSSNTLANQPTQPTAPIQITQPASTQAQKPVSYKMVNVYLVMTQLTLYKHEDDAALKKKFFDIDKANKYAQTIVNEYRTKKYSQERIVETWDNEHRYSCQITHNDNKTTKVFIKAVPMSPKEIDKYDPREVHPRFANRYYAVRFERTTEHFDAENQEVLIIERTAGFADASKLYTALEMANHAACEYLVNELKPREEVEEHHNLYQEITSQIRTNRDDCKSDLLFCCEVDQESISWAGFKSLKVEVEGLMTEGPIN